jgi:hypothetical protein
MRPPIGITTTASATYFAGINANKSFMVFSFKLDLHYLLRGSLLQIATIRKEQQKV